jgi:hypothetical protein
MPGSFGTSPTEDGVVASTGSSGKSGVFGSNTGTDPAPSDGVGGVGVFGLTVVPSAAGVFGANNHASAGVGVQGNGPEAGISGFSEEGVGLRAHSNHGDGTQSFAHSEDHNAVLGSNDAGGTAPTGGAPAGIGVFGVTTVGNAAGVFGANNHASAGVGVQGNGPEAGISGFSENGVGGRAFSKNGIGFLASGPKLAARFDGDVEVSGDVRLTGADLAEHFELKGPASSVPPGTVVVLDGCDRVSVSSTAYDPRVAGVVSGAGGYCPGILLDHHGATAGREPIALAGKVYCRVDASFGRVQIGDLLTTSPTPGHAMRATDQQRAFGSVLGKAMEPLESGTALLPILVTLQ